MNNAKMWLVVKPTVGIPLFLTAVAVSSFAVHVAVVRMAPWLQGYYQGNPINPAMASLDAPVQVAPAQQAAFVVPGSQEVLVLMPDGTAQRAILQPEGTLALK